MNRWYSSNCSIHMLFDKRNVNKHQHNIICWAVKTGIGRTKHGIDSATGEWTCNYGKHSKRAQKNVLFYWSKMQTDSRALKLMFGFSKHMYKRKEKFEISTNGSGLMIDDLSLIKTCRLFCHFHSRRFFSSFRTWIRLSYSQNNFNNACRD